MDKTTFYFRQVGTYEEVMSLDKRIKKMQVWRCMRHTFHKWQTKSYFWVSCLPSVIKFLETFVCCSAESNWIKWLNVKSCKIFKVLFFFNTSEVAVSSYKKTSDLCVLCPTLKKSYVFLFLFIHLFYTSNCHSSHLIALWCYIRKTIVSIKNTTCTVCLTIWPETGRLDTVINRWTF